MRIKPLVALLFWILEFDYVRRTHSIIADFHPLNQGQPSFYLQPNR